jgi:MFS family permease
MLCKNPHNWNAGLYTATMNLPIMIVAGLFGAQFMSQSYGFNSLQSSMISMMIFIGTIVGSSVFGILSDFLKERRRPMIAAAMISLILFCVILFGPSCGYFTYLIFFFLLGFTTAAQIIGYPVTQELNPRSLSGSALGFISVMIMGLPILFQPLCGYLMDVHERNDGVYTLGDYRLGLSVLSVGFVISILTAYCLPESYGVKIDEI